MQDNLSIHHIQSFLKDLLDPTTINDYTINGIQIENDTTNIKKIAFAVDASLDTITECIKNKCQLLIVHHGLFWNTISPIKGMLKKRIKSLLTNDIGLIAYHLPLDLHPEYGNSIQIIKKIRSVQVDPHHQIKEKIYPFGHYKGLTIGWYAEYQQPFLIEEIIKKLNLSFNDNNIKYLPFGNSQIYKIAVVSGSGGQYFEDAVNKNIDLYITGDSEHILYHNAKENRINILFAGHYHTELFGVKALQELIKNHFKVETYFIDLPTGL